MPREFILPGTEPRYAPDRPFEIQHYKLELDLDVENACFAGTCTIRVAAMSQEERYIEIDAVELDILRVRIDDEDRNFRHDGGILRVHFGEPLVIGTAVEIAIDYSATPRRGLYFVGPDEHYPDKPKQVWTQGQDEDSRYWFPCLDSPIFKATSETVVRVPKSWFALSNGTLMSNTVTGDTRTFHWRFDVPHSCYLMMLAAGDFAEHRESWNGVDVTYYSAPEQLENCKRSLSKTPEMLEAFSELFGVPYPYEKYAQVFVTDFIFGGMENTTATTLTDSLLVDERASLDFDMESLVCHELAHQWFGDLLTCRDWGEGWLNEGFATYSEYLWSEYSRGRDEASLVLAAFSEAYFAEDSGRYRRSIVTKHFEAPLDIFDRHLYDKAGRVVHMIRRILGDADFFTSVQHYLEHHRAGVVETRDLARCIDRACGRNLDWFFDQWLLHGSGHPEVSVNVKWHEDEHVLEVSVAQTHEITDKTPLFRLPTELRVVDDDETRDIRIELRRASHVFTIPCKREPTQVIFDPGKHLICRIRSEKPVAMWIQELAEAAEAQDRIAAAKMCGQRGGHAAHNALATSLTSDSFWAVRAAAAEALGSMRTPRAADILIRELHQAEHPKVRRAVAASLGNFRGNEAVAQALSKRIESGDPSYFVEAECCAALGKTRSPQALNILSAAMFRESIMDIIQQKCCDGLAALGSDDAIPLLMGQSELGKGSFARRAAMRGLASIGKERSDGESRKIRERLVDLLGDPDYRVQLQAIVSLEALGDVRATSALQRVVDEGFDARLKRKSREAIRSLSEGLGRAEELAKLREESELLRIELASLQSRLAVIETARSQERQSRRRASAPAQPESAPVRRRQRGGGKKPLR